MPLSAIVKYESSPAKVKLILIELACASIELSIISATASSNSYPISLNDLISLLALGINSIRIFELLGVC
jgi:hypothetical protein